MNFLNPLFGIAPRNQRRLTPKRRRKIIRRRNNRTRREIARGGPVHTFPVQPNAPMSAFARVNRLPRKF